ncbi:MAG: hypothetical protein ACKOKE_02130 [Actinomycetota bacterium]
MWTAIAAVATGAWGIARGPLQAFLEFAMAASTPIAAGRICALLAPRSRSAPSLAASLAATAIVIVDLYLLREVAPIPGMIGAAIGYRWERRRFERGVDASTSGDGPGPERSGGVILRRLVVSLASASFAIFCFAKASSIGAADVSAEWLIRASISGAVAAGAMLRALRAWIDLSVRER